MKEPLGIGTFLHSANRARIAMLITGWQQDGSYYKYQVIFFWYKPKNINYRLKALTAASYGFQKSISSPKLKKEGWRVVDVSNGEVAK